MTENSTCYETVEGEGEERVSRHVVTENVIPVLQYNDEIIHARSLYE